MSDDWPLEIDGDEFHPLPESWIEAGYDSGDDHRRIYAVSVATITDGRQLRVRFAHPTNSNVLTLKFDATDGENGPVPYDSRAPGRTWPRSVVPAHDPTHVIRTPEMRHLRDLWGGRVDDVPADDDLPELIADGGPRVFGTRPAGSDAVDKEGAQ